MTTSETAPNPHGPFPSAFSNALVAALSEATESPWLVAAVPDSEPAADELEPVRFKFTLQGNLEGEFLLEFRHTDAILLATKCLRQAADELGSEQREALLKLIETGMNRFRSAADAEYGAFTITAEIADEPPAEPVNRVQVTAADDAGNRVSFHLYLDPALSEALSLQAEKVKAEGPAKTESVPPNPEHLNLNLVMDVELNVTLRFGQRQLALREILELTSGSVIELDRQVEEPVELLLEGKVIARGEAVVIDGNYGLRVTEVPQPIPTPVLR
jgi:flagellar motor switch protein FliN